MRELFFSNRHLFYEAVRSKVLREAEQCIIGNADEFVVDVAIFRPYRTYVESEAEEQLFAYLNSIYPGLVERQKVLPDLSRIDLAMLSYGVEVKLFNKFNKVELDRAIGQALEYTKHFERVILVVYYTSPFLAEKLHERLKVLPLRDRRVTVIIRKVEKN